MSKEIYNEEEARKLLLEGINELADTVTLTMGPQGRTVIISDNNGNPYITKDGFSVARDIRFEDTVKNIAANLIKEVSKNTVEEAGDGTTTAICLAQAIINLGYRLMTEDKMSYREIKQELEDLEELVTTELKNAAQKIKKSDIKSVASIASNGDETMATHIAVAYNSANIVKVEESNKEEDSITTIKGLKLDTGFFDKSLINNPAKQSIEYKNIPLMIIDGHLNDLQNIGIFLQENKDGVAIMADHFSDEVISIIRDNFNRGVLKIALIKSPGFATHRRDLLEDLAVFTTGEIINPNKSIINKVIGMVDSLVVTQNRVLITKDSYNIKVEERAKELKSSLKGLTKTQQKLTQERIDNLSGSLAIIQVGGSSEVEMKERKDRYDDAVLAVSCAIEEGVIAGGGVELMNIFLNMYVDNKFLEVVQAPYFTIRANGEEFPVDTQENMIKRGIIDPVKVTRVAFKNAVSVAKTILSVKAVVQNNQRWN